MNESDFEKELRSLLPISPSPKLAERIADDLREVALVPSAPRQLATGMLPRADKTNRGFDWRWILLPLAGAAMVAVVFSITERKDAIRPQVAGNSTPGPMVALNESPDESVSELIETTDEGLVYDENDEIQRQVRMTFLEHHFWTNPHTGAVIEFEVPREDIVLMPVAMQ